MGELAQPQPELTSDLYHAAAQFLGFQMEANPHLTIAKFVDDTFAFYSWWYKPKWDGLDVHGHTGQDFTQYQEYMREHA
eukprot:12694110-Prorocentrum_lima.AAC.1